MIADSNIEYSDWITIHLGWMKYIKAYYTHALVSTAGFLVIVMFNPTAYYCLFGEEMSVTLSQVVPILAGTVLCTVYSGAYKLSPKTTTTTPTTYGSTV
jgi:hypothetical protein